MGTGYSKKKLENGNQVVKEDVKEDEDYLKEDGDYLRSFRRLGLKGQGDWQADEDGEEKEDRSDCNHVSEELALIIEELLWDFPGIRHWIHQVVPTAGQHLWLAVLSETKQQKDKITEELWKGGLKLKGQA